MQALVSNHNIRRMFKNKETLNLTGSESWTPLEYGITTPLLSRTMAVTGTIVLLLTIVGSFAIDGETGTGTKSVIAKSVVVRARGFEEAIDFSKHISESGRRVSGTLLLARAARVCGEVSTTTITAYSMVGGEMNLDSTVYDVNEPVANSTCRSEVDGFQEHIIFQLKLLSGMGVVEGCKYDMTAPTEGDSGVWPGNATIRGCELEAIETWCANFAQSVCIGLARHSEGFLHLVRVGVNGSGPLHPVRVIPVFYGIADDKRILQSMAYLFAVGFESDFVILRTMAWSVAKMNEPVEILTGAEPKTLINIWLLGFTAGTALLVTVFMVVVTLVSWKKNSFDKELRGCNGVSSALGVMVCAASISRGEDDYEVPKEGILVGVSRRVPHVGPLHDFEERDLLNDQGNVYDERELEGRDRDC